MDRKWIVRAWLLTIASAILFTWLSLPGRPLSFRGAHTAAQAVLNVPANELSENNLVDGISSMKLTMGIAKVDLNDSILSIDLKVTEGTLQKEMMYYNMAEVISFAFEETGNIEQLLLRLVAEDRWSGRRYLLLAADVRRGEWPPSALEELRNTGEQELSSSLLRWFRITLTQLWREHIPR